MALAERMGGVDSQITETVMDLLFNSVDKLLGGNYNTIKYQRHQIISNEGKLVIDSTNNPLGVPLTLDFGVSAKNKFTDRWYSVNSSTGVVTEQSGIDPIKKLKDIKKAAENKDYAPAGHWEVAKHLGYYNRPALFQEMWAQAMRPEITNADAQLAYGNIQDDDTIKAFIEKRIEPYRSYRRYSRS